MEHFQLNVFVRVPLILSTQSMWKVYRRVLLILRSPLTVVIGNSCEWRSVVFFANVTEAPVVIQSVRREENAMLGISSNRSGLNGLSPECV